MPDVAETTIEGVTDESAPTPEITEGSADSQPQLFNVKVNGVELEVTADELVKGYMRQADYTQKTQTLAEQQRCCQSTSTRTVSQG